MRHDSAATLALEGATEVALSRDQVARWRESVESWPLPSANISTTYSIDGTIDPDVLRDAFTHVVARHDQLRLRIVADDGPPRASIRPPEPTFRLSVVDLRGLDPAARERIRTLYAVREAAVPIDLSRDLPVRAKLVTLADGRHELLLTVSHVAADGWSLGIVVRDLVTCYRALVAGEPGPSGEPPSFSEHVADEERRHQTGEIARHLPWWRESLRGARAELGLDVRAGQNGADALFHRFHVDDAAGRAARRFARATGVSLYVLGLALLGVQVRRRTGRADLVVATPFVGRRFPRFTDTVGLFVTRLLMRLDLHGASSFADLVRRVNVTVLDAVEHADVSRDLLVADMLSRGEVVTPQVVFQTFPRELAEDAEGADPALRLVDMRTSALPFALAYHVSEAGDAGLLGWFGHRTSLLTASEASAWIDEFRELFDTLVRHPERPLP